MKDYYIEEVESCLNDYRDNIYGFFTDIRYQFGIDGSNLPEEEPETIKMDEKEYELNNEENPYNDMEEELDEEETEEDMDDVAEKYQNYSEFILSLMKQIKGYKKEQYEFMMLTMYHDTCIILNDFDNKFYKLNREIFKELEAKVKTKEELFELIESDFCYLADIISFFIDFCGLDYFSKRKLMIDSYDLDKYLNKIYPLHILDKFYYTMPYTENTLIKVFDDNMFLEKNGITGNPINQVAITLNDLYYSDPNNYYELMIPLISNYYKYALYNQNKYDTEKELVNKIEEWDISILLTEVVNDMKFMEQIVAEFYNHNYVYDDVYKNIAQEIYDKKISSAIRKKLTIDKKK